MNHNCLVSCNKLMNNVGGIPVKENRRYDK